MKKVTILSTIVAIASGLLLVFKSSLILKIAIIVSSISILFGANSYAQDAQKNLVIRENFFVTMINDIYLNPKAYMNSNIEFEGMVNKFTYTPSPGAKPMTKYFVFRYGPGCCGSDLYAGFEVRGDVPSVKEGDWVKVVGRLEEYTENKEQYLRIYISKMEKMQKRGKETVIR
jgi:uncharacterized membrane protein YcgQ (UPF0703/DUF1980 family)